MIFMNAMLRSSLIWASETYYNLKEQEIRQIERIEENFMRQLLKTRKSCPINQLYTELGQVPARFDIIKMRIFFLKYILEQDPESSLAKMYKLQLQNPKRGDWASQCKKSMEKIKLNLSNEQIRNMTKYEFKNLVRKKCKESAYQYLMNKRGKKGEQIIYSSIRMSEYLLPNEKMSIEDQRKKFEIRNKLSHKR